MTWTMYQHAYPALPVRVDLVGTRWWRVLVDEVAPRYDQLRRSFEQHTVTAERDIGQVYNTVGNKTYQYQKRVASAAVVLDWVKGVCELQTLLKNADIDREASDDYLVIDLSGVTVQGDLVLPELDLPELLCHSTVFTDLADFSLANFSTSVCFDYAHFKGEARFKNATFNGNSSFRRAIFEKDVCFFCADGKALFDSAVFAGFADFEGAILNSENIRLESCVFLGTTDFVG